MEEIRGRAESRVLKITALLESDATPFDMPQKRLASTRTFIDVLDGHKALLVGAKDGEERMGVEDFGLFVQSLGLSKYPYIGGAAPRTNIPVLAGDGAEIVFTANESPPDQPIPFHHELAQSANPPHYVFFFCDQPAQSGGETPIIDSTAVFRFAQENHPAFVDKLKECGARYTRTLPASDDPSSPIGRSYQNTYGVTSPSELDEKLKQTAGIEWKWLEDGCVRVTSEPVPALRLVADHETNYVYQWTFANAVIAAFLGWQDSRNDRHEAVMFGDNSKMDESVLESIANFMEANKVAHPWKAGEILVLNNRLVMHSRNNFSGLRKVYASLWGDVADKEKLRQRAGGVSIGSIPESFHQPHMPEDPLVFGFWKVDKAVCEEVCYQAIASGYRRLDCACDYGNEVQVGRGIARAISDGLCTRDDLFVTSKLWNTFHHPQHVPIALTKTLTDLQLGYVDEYLIHFPISMEYVPIEAKYPPEWTNLEGKMVVVPQDLMATWRAMEAEVANGRARTIGICNFSTQLLRQLLSTCTIRPSTLQVEIHPHNSQEKLIRFAREAGMKVTAFSVFGASSYLELGMAGDGDLLMKDSTVLAVATRHRKSPAQILLRWAVQRGTFALHKTSTPARMKENRAIFDFNLTMKEMEDLNNLNKNRRYNDPGVFCELGMGTFCPIYD